MRTIKFRGKRTDTKEWVYGFYNFTIYDDGSDPLMSIMRVHIIADADGYVWSIDENTVGQFTGLTNENGKEIYEGDICVSIDGLCLIRWDEKRFMFVVSYYDYPNEELSLEELWEDNEIIGNIHDNPELLGGSE